MPGPPFPLRGSGLSGSQDWRPGGQRAVRGAAASTGPATVRKAWTQHCECPAGEKLIWGDGPRGIGGCFRAVAFGLTLGEWVHSDQVAGEGEEGKKMGWVTGISTGFCSVGIVALLSNLGTDSVRP